MRATLEFFVAHLKLSVSTTCHHLRNKAYPAQSQQFYNVMSLLVYNQILVDELGQLLYAHERLIDTLEKYMRGESLDLFDADRDVDQTIWEYCLAYFQGELPLGQTTPELTEWVANYADRNQLFRESFYSFFPGVEIKVAGIDPDGVVELQEASDAEKFDSAVSGFMNDVEISNALAEFNQDMQQVRLMLEQQEPVEDILIVLHQK